MLRRLMGTLLRVKRVINFCQPNKRHILGIHGPLTVNGDWKNRDLYVCKLCQEPSRDNDPFP